MKDYIFKVLFKNGIEKEIKVNAFEEDCHELINSIYNAYSQDVSGVFVIGFSYIKISETVFMLTDECPLCVVNNIETHLNL